MNSPLPTTLSGEAHERNVTLAKLSFRVRLSHSVSIFSTALLLVASFAVQWTQIEALRGTGLLVNEAGFQRAQSEQIAHGVTMLASHVATAEETVRQRHALVEQLAQWRTVQAGFERAGETKSIKALTDPELRAIGRRVRVEMDAVSAGVSDFLERDCGPGGDERCEADHRLVTTRQDAFMREMHGYTSRLADFGEAEIDGLRRLQVILLAAAVMVLVAKVVLILMPVERFINGVWHELRQLNGQLERAAKAAEVAAHAKSEFLAMMSHEIRTPLNGVLGIAALLSETPLNAEQVGYVRILSNSGDALLNVINDVLDFSKIESGRMEVEQTTFSLREMAENTVELMAAKAHEKGLELVLDLTGLEEPHVVGDPGRLRQILLNYLSNALKFTARGQILVRVFSLEKPFVRLEVIDTGIGVSGAHLARLFTAFTQADSSTTRRFGGTGLGLAVSKRLAELMGGRVGASSEVGLGSTFYVEVPLESAQMLEPAVAPATLIGKHLLIVDDNMTNLLILETTLRRHKARVTALGSAEEALRYLADTPLPPDAVILDLRMPGMDGLSLAEAMGRDGDGKRPPIVLLGSHRDQDSLERAQSLGITQFLVKPVREVDLLRAVHGMLHAPAREEVPAEAVVERGSALRVLLAEDNAVNQFVMGSLLKKHGCEVTVAVDGREAVAQWAANPFDAVLLDCQMPVMDGYEAAAQIRQLEAAGKRILIAAVTANASVEDRQRCIDAGMDEYLTKPLRPDQLQSLVARIRDRRELSQPASGWQTMPTPLST